MKIKFIYFEKDELSLVCDKEVNMCRGLAKIEKYNIESAEGITEANLHGVKEVPTIILLADNNAELARWEREVVGHRDILDEIEECK